MRVDRQSVFAIVALFGAVAVAPANANDGLFRCSARDITRLGDDCSPSRYNDDSVFYSAFGHPIVDTSTGALRVSGRVQQWRVIQRGSSADDFVAVADYTDADAVTDYSRIRSWHRDQPVAFFELF